MLLKVKETYGNFNYKQSAFYYFKIQNLILVEPTYSIMFVM